MDKALLKEEYKRLLRQAVGDRTGSMALMMVLEELARIGQADAVVPGPPRGGQMEQSRSNRRKRMVFGVATAGQSIFRSGPA